MTPLIMPDKGAQWMKNRMTVLNNFDAEEPLNQTLPAKMRMRALFIARVSEAKVFDRVRELADEYFSGKFGLADVREKIKALVDENGGLATRAGLELGLRQAVLESNAVGKYAAGFDPDLLNAFPAWQYVAMQGARTTHAEYNGKIYLKTDPIWDWLFPPRDFNCRCTVREVMQKEIDAKGLSKDDPTPRENASGYTFRSREAFDEFDMTSIPDVKSRERMVSEIEKIVEEERVPRVSITAPQDDALNIEAPLKNQREARKVFDDLREPTRSHLRDSGLNPDKLPDWKTTTEKAGLELPESVAHAMKNGVDIGDVSRDLLKKVGLPGDSASVRFSLEPKAGGDKFGLRHTYKHHKEVFAKKGEAEKILRETLGNRGASIGLTLGVDTKVSASKALSRVLSIHNEKTGAYVVLKWDEDHWEIVSMHRDGMAYRDRQRQFKDNKKTRLRSSNKRGSTQTGNQTP